jgi:hypothetical protein
VVFELTVEPSMAMFCAVADPADTAPWTLRTTWLSDTSLLLSESALRVESDATSWSEEFLEESLLCALAEFHEELVLSVLFTLEDAALFDALLLLLLLASCDARPLEEFFAALEESALLEAELLLALL